MLNSTHVSTSCWWSYLSYVPGALPILAQVSGKNSIAMTSLFNCSMLEAQKTTTWYSNKPVLAAANTSFTCSCWVFSAAVACEPDAHTGGPDEGTTPEEPGASPGISLEASSGFFVSGKGVAATKGTDWTPTSFSVQSIALQTLGSKMLLTRCWTGMWEFFGTITVFFPCSRSPIALLPCKSPSLVWSPMSWQHKSYFK